MGKSKTSQSIAKRSQRSKSSARSTPSANGAVKSLAKGSNPPNKSPTPVRTLENMNFTDRMNMIAQPAWARSFARNLNRFVESFAADKGKPGVTSEGERIGGLRIVPLYVLGHKSSQGLHHFDDHEHGKRIQEYHKERGTDATLKTDHFWAVNGPDGTVELKESDTLTPATREVKTYDVGTINGLDVVDEMPGDGGGIDWVGDPEIVAAAAFLKDLHCVLEMAIADLLKH